MAQEGFDKLLSLTDSRYRLSMIVARRAAQLKAGIPPLLDDEEKPRTTNTVTIAMKELELGKPIQWGDHLPLVAEGLRASSRRSVEPRSGAPAPAAAAE